MPTANLPVRFELVGPGAIIGLGNGDPNCHEPEKGDSRSLFNGLAQVIVQSAPQSSGRIELRAIASGLTAAEVVVDVAAVPARPEVAPVRPTFFVSHWRMSPLSAGPPSPNWQIASTDMNAGPSIQPGRLQAFTKSRFAIFRAQFKPRATVQKEGGRLVFSDLVGKAQVWVDGELVGEKNDPQRQTLSVRLPPGDEERAIDVLIEAPPGSQAGLGGTVTVE